MDERKIREYLDRGGILVEMIFDFHIKTDREEELKGLATEFCNEFIQNSLNSGLIYFGVAEIEQPESAGEYMSTYAKLTVMFKSLPFLIQTVINYNPVSLEIIAMRDEKIVIEHGNLQDLLNEISKQVFDIKASMLTQEKQKELQEIYKRRLDRGKKILQKHDKDRY